MDDMKDKKKEKDSDDFSDEEKAAMRRQVQKEARSAKNRATGQAAITEAINVLPEPDGSIARKIDEIVSKNAPSLIPRTWYGFPAYANSGGKIICFYQPASKFKTRYGTFGFQQDARLDDGNMWPVAFAVDKITDVEEVRIADLVKKAVT